MSDQDPYRPPKTEGTPEPAGGNSLSWKAFFWITAVLMGLSTLGVLTMENLAVFDYVDFIFSIIGTVALGGFAFYKPIGAVVFWRYFFYVVLIESILISVLFPLMGIPVYGQITKIDYYYFVGLVYGVAMLYAIYQYAYRRPFIWVGN